MNRYDHSKIEPKWQKHWEVKKLNHAREDSTKKKFYALIEFPYPSGDGLHVGHIRSNTAMDVVARKRRREGFEVLYPIGWDAFGLPTENFAIKTGIQPEIVTKKNTDTFRRQLKSLGFSFDWSREINTTDPKYYKWTQWIFLQMLKKGLAYKKKMEINWCPKDLIGLANEEVIDGCCERCGTKVEKKEKEQWMLAITQYADRLDKDLDLVDYLPRVKTQQRNWIGKSEGAEINFKIVGNDTVVKIFTTRPDTIFGATYIVLAPESLYAQELVAQAENTIEVAQYIQDVKSKTDIERTSADKEKTGVELKGVRAISPGTGEEIPVYVADYVLAHYGTGAVMAVPAHDERDAAFAKKYGLPVKHVVESLSTLSEGPDAVKPGLPFVERDAAVCIVRHWSEEKYLMSFYRANGWKGFIVGGLEGGETPAIAGTREIHEESGYKNARFVRDVGVLHSQFFHQVKAVNRSAHFKVAYFELADGERDEMSEDEKKLHEVVWLSEGEVEKAMNREDIQLAWKFFKKGPCFTGEGILVNSGKFNGKNSTEVKKEITESVGGTWVTKFKLRDWVFSRQRYWGEPIPVVHCEQCGVVPVPEKELPIQLPKVKNYKPTETGESPLAAIEKWVNTKCPQCKGKAKRETDTMPNWAGSSWYYLRYADSKNKKEFASIKNLKYWTPVDWYNGGMEHTTLHLLYSRFWHKFLYDQGLVPTNEPYQKRTSHGLILAEGGEKMSKSKGNVVNPDELIKVVGADTLRVHEMFMGPFDQAIAWDTNTIAGSRRFIERIWALHTKVGESQNTQIDSLMQKTIKKVSTDIEEMRFNTAISALMIAVNDLEKETTISKENYEILLGLVAPFAPHVADELWSLLKNKKSIHLAPWPIFDEKRVVEGSGKIVVQINGKMRATFEAPPGTGDKELEELAKKLPEVGKWIEGKNIAKVIVVKGRVVNIVLI
ncbi:MAG: class I tRNA ligase family protein [Patescibacteria group bacterium]